MKGEIQSGSINSPVVENETETETEFPVRLRYELTLAAVLQIQSTMGEILTALSNIKQQEHY